MKNNYYEKISDIEFRKISEIRIKLTPTQISIIGKITNVEVDKNDSSSNRIGILPMNGWYYSNYIIQIPDEWFIVFPAFIDGNIYKCDQFDGLLKCLEDIL